jgi:ATPase
MRTERLVPDTSVIIEGLLSRRLTSGEINAEEIIVHEALLLELEKQSRESRISAELGMAELDKLGKMLGEKLRFAGRKPSFAELNHLGLREIDSLARELAFDENALLYTADRTQERLARVKGVRCLFEKGSEARRGLKLERFFDQTTMSVHLRESVKPYAKRGQPGDWNFTETRSEPLTREEIEGISQEIIEAAESTKDGFIEIERPGSTIIQLGLYRIVITRPPFSDGWEITAVRPVKQLSIEDYSLSEKLKKRLDEQADGILIAGSPGMGKSTFAAALAQYYAAKNKIVKTVEAPRDLVLPENITQYAISHADPQEIHDILLLSRPDYTFFDEMRNTNDFRLFADLRLAGIGFVGVVHATKAIDAIQRFIGRIELGVIPQVVDTVIFIKDGMISKVLSLQMLVKVPSGMQEQDLARPVVVVSDFETRKPEYELYSYGEETVVIPVVEDSRENPLQGLARKQIEHEFRKYSDQVKVVMSGDRKCIVYVPEERIAAIIGKQGKTITEIEERLGIGIDVKELSESEVAPPKGKPVPFNTKIGKNITFMLDSEMVDRNVSVAVNGDYLLTAKVSQKGQIKIKKNNKIAKIIIDAINMGEKIEVVGL